MLGIADERTLPSERFFGASTAIAAKFRRVRCGILASLNRSAGAFSGGRYSCPCNSFPPSSEHSCEDMMPGPLGTNGNSPVIDSGTLSLNANTPPRPTCVTRVPPSAKNNTDISRSDGERVVAEAITWIGTAYALIGQSSAKQHGGDCSGSTLKIFVAAGFPYIYQASGTFRHYAASTGIFRQLLASESMQSGDILSWPNHMAVHAEFAATDPHATTDRVNSSGTHWTQRNNMLTATHPGGAAYQAAEQRYFRADLPKVYRYQRIAGGVCPA